MKSRFQSNKSKKEREMVYDYEIYVRHFIRYYPFVWGYDHPSIPLSIELLGCSGNEKLKELGKGNSKLGWNKRLVSAQNFRWQNHRLVTIPSKTRVWDGARKPPCFVVTWPHRTHPTQAFTFPSRVRSPTALPSWIWVQRGRAGQSRKDKSDRDCLSNQMVRPTSQRWGCFPSRKSRKHGDLRDTARSCVLNTTVHLKHENDS